MMYSAIDRRHRLLDADAPRPGISGTAYDTAWLASVPAQGDRRLSRFPTSLRWLTENQLTDGSWGSPVHYAHDRLLCTLAAVTPLAQFGRRSEDRDAVAAATRYLWQHGDTVRSEAAQLIGFELLLPTLVQRARGAGIAVPPQLDAYTDNRRTRKLSQLPPEALYSPRGSVVHALEFLGDRASLPGLRAAQGANGAIGNSPAATAFYLAGSNDARAQQYLSSVLDRTGGAMAPVLHPCETFELLWAAYHLHLGGIPTARLLTPIERAFLRSALAGGGVSLSPSFPIPDADHTALALLLLHARGDEIEPSVLRAFATPEGHFVSEPYHRQSAAGVGLNLHVLHALSRMPEYPDVERAIERVVCFIGSQHTGEYWMDRWHVSPYYATSHAICVFDDLSAHQTRRIAHLVERSRNWIRHTQNPDGSWGFYGQPTTEETAYALLALMSGRVLDEMDEARCAAGMAYLNATSEGDVYPPLWIDKCLYTPALVVRAAIEAARTVYARRCDPAALGA
jgi:halimadienyl-diphosphate synthase